MKSIDFIEKIENFTGNYIELIYLIRDYLSTKDEDPKYKLKFYNDHIDKIEAVKKEVKDKRNSKLSFNYQKFYDFQYMSLIITYYHNPAIYFESKEDKNLIYNLYRTYCNNFKYKEEFTPDDFKFYKLSNPYCNFLIVEFLNKEAKIQPLCHKIFFPYNVADKHIQRYCPFTVEYDYDDKEWLCAYNETEFKPKRTNLNIDVSKISDKEIMDKIVYFLGLLPDGATA